MAPPLSQQITRWLGDWRQGDNRARDELFAVVHPQLRQIAARYLQHERADHTLEPNALVNELWVRLMGTEPLAFNDRAHFFAVAAKIMRRVLVSQAVARQCDKRGGSAVLVSLDEALGAADRSIDFVLLDEALYKLASFDERKSRIIELRFFGGLTMEETAEVLHISPATVGRDWTLAKAWLYAALTTPVQ